MKKVILFVSAVLLLFANTAMADSIAGKIGISAQGGASYIFNSEFTDQAIANTTINKEIKPDLGYAAGGGIIYGITDNLAVNFNVIYFQADARVGSYPLEAILGRGKSIDFALGAQWRFLPKSQFVPYVEAGVDVLLNRFDTSEFVGQMLGGANTNLDVDTTYGGHLSVGGDFFFNPHVALNAEIRGLYSTEGNVKISNSFVVAKYNPSNISAFLGIKFFFP